MGAEVRIGGATLRLLPERAAYLEAERALLVADVHLGKAQAFRRLGVPVPEGTTAGTLARLARAVAATGARQVVILGDLLHAPLHPAAKRLARPGDGAAAADDIAASATVRAVADWRRRHAALRLTLVRGNHDAKAGDPPAEWRMEVVDEPWPLGPLALRHEPEPDAAGRYVLAGHLHPALHLAGRGPGRMRLPCFHFGSSVGVLPAFGEFTGSTAVRAQPGDRLFAIADDEVREIAALHCPAPQGALNPSGTR
ncbi:MAG: ligase-associated DNA damage response endonuclease PdeM [Rubrivivax sp.]|nr:ligase-associated DNA damage response endonuclease PdeM [Rubrivivax sp.]